MPKCGNYVIKIGTKIGHVLKECGVEDLDGYKVVLGGPMTGGGRVRFGIRCCKRYYRYLSIAT